MPEIIIQQGHKRFHLNWELVHQDHRCKRFKVYPPANPEKYLILENNEPLIRGKYHLKHRRIDWEYKEGEKLRDKTLNAIIQGITSSTSTERGDDTPVPQLKTYNKKKNPPSRPTLGERN
jgi:hypothetical protein